ncbi:MAG: YqiA/YcfP family alpha/beta fold hydrolase [Hydrogenothermaceae bacterium]
MKILYIHGFNSAGYGDKINYLKKAFGARNVIAPTLDYDPVEAVSQLEFLTEAIKDRDKLYLVGTSLGGFYAIYLSLKFKVPAVLINPSIDPYKSLQKQVGPQKNFKTDEEYIFTQQHLESLKNFYVKELEPIKNLVYVYLDEDDELLDSRETARYFEGFHVVIYPGGNHRFTHMPQLIEDFKKILQEDR